MAMAFFQQSSIPLGRLIKAIHGENGEASSFYNHVRDQGVCGRIVRSINSMHEKGLVPHSFLHRCVSNGTSTNSGMKHGWGILPSKISFPAFFA